MEQFKITYNSVFKSRRIFLHLFFFFTGSLICNAQAITETASIQESNRLLKKIWDTTEVVTLIVVEKTFMPELKRIESVIEGRGANSKHKQYLNRQRQDIKKEKAIQDVFQKELRVATEKMIGFDKIYFLSDTAWNACIKTGQCLVQNRDSSKVNLVLDQDNFAFLSEGYHPSTRKRGLYFYTTEKKYLDSPFVDYLPSNRTIDALINALDPSKDSRIDPEALVTKFNRKLYRKLQGMADFYAKFEEQ